MSAYTYTVDGIGFNSFFQAVETASKTRSLVIEASTGRTRWSPPEPVSTERQARYLERLAAYEAQQRMRRNG